MARGKKDMRRGRARRRPILFADTGAATAATKALPELEGKFDGISRSRGPVPVDCGGCRRCWNAMSPPRKSTMRSVKKRQASATRAS
ncbi:MAG: hypothetical protein U0670_25025 [Anaerolineae bacterium]